MSQESFLYQKDGSTSQFVSATKPKTRIAEKNVNVYYNWHLRIFSLTPPLSALNFLSFLVSEFCSH